MCVEHSVYRHVTLIMKQETCFWKSNEQINSLRASIEKTLIKILSVHDVHVSSNYDYRNDIYSINHIKVCV